MKILLLFLASAVAFGQQIDLTRNTRGTLPETKGGTGTSPSGTLPALCSTGRIFFKTNATSGQKIYGCESTNTWVPQGGAGGTPAFSSVLAGTNTAALVVGSLGSLTFSGSGTINATHLAGVAAALFAPLASPVFTGTPTIPAAGWSLANHAHLGATTGGTLTEAALALTDITTNDASLIRHGLVPKLSGNASQFLNGVGGWAFTSGGSGAVRYVVPFNAGAPILTRTSAIMEYELTLTGTATPTTAGFAGADLFSTKICQDATGGRAYTAPTGFSAMAAPVTLALACTTQWAYWDGTNAIPLSGANVDIGPNETPVTTAPTGSPAGGKVWDWVDSTSLVPTWKDSTGQLTVPVRPTACSGGTPALGSIGANGAVTCVAAGGGGGGTPGGSTTQVQRNLAGAFSGDSGLTYDGAGTVTASVAFQTPSSGSSVSQYSVYSGAKLTVKWDGLATCTGAITLSAFSFQDIALTTGNCTASLAASSLSPGQEITLRILQDPAVARTFTCPTTGTVFHGCMTIGTTLSKYNVQTFVVGPGGNDAYATGPGVINQ